MTKNVPEIKPGNYFIFIAFMRVAATTLITNTHFGQIWPISQIAVGGLIGDLLFFAISGFCLLNSAQNGFLKYSSKRILRIYPSVIIITLVFLLTGNINATGIFGGGGYRTSLIGLFIYPTTFHFIESIVLLYICLYPCIRFDLLRKRLPVVMIAVACLFTIAYIFADTTVRLDTAAHFLTKFLFFEVMLYGAYMRMNIKKHRRPILNCILFLISLVVYFSLKMFINENKFPELQILIFVSLFFVGMTAIRAFSALENVFLKIPQKALKAVQFIADMTLEIYVVQTTLIRVVVSLQLPFFARFPIVVFLIVGCAFLLNRTSKYVVMFFGMLWKKGLQKQSKR